MKTYTSTPTSKLIPGMVIHFYGEEFRIMGNPVPCKNPLPPPPTTNQTDK